MNSQNSIDELRRKLPLMLSFKVIHREIGITRGILISWIKYDILSSIKTPGGQRRFFRDQVLQVLDQRNQKIKEGYKRYIPQNN